MPATVAIVQARMGSSRLPGKVLKMLSGEPMLARVVKRVSRSHRVDKVLVATTTEQRDDALADWCAGSGWSCFRGSEHDVLDRYYHAAKGAGAEVIVRITSDCPLIDPEIISAVVEGLELQGSDYCSNVFPRTYPRGLDVEAFTFSALETAWREDRNPEWREHVTQFIVRHPERFAITNLNYDDDCSAFRWTVDTPEDFALMEKICAHFPSDDFSWRGVLAVVERHPDWTAINQHIEQKAT
jgi:spore coat polysaccharide biosynthesis protein SpsF